jgi:hypothetical protein
MIFYNMLKYHACGIILVWYMKGNNGEDNQTETL